MSENTSQSNLGMQLGSCYVCLDKHGNTVPKTDVTPAEVILLASEHVHNTGDNPVRDIKVTGEDKERTVSQELARLKSRYDSEEVERLFPGVTEVKLPKTFVEADKIVKDLIESGKTKAAIRTKKK